MDMDLNDYTMRYKQGVKVVTMKEGTTWFGCLNAGGATLEAQLDGERHLVVAPAADLAEKFRVDTGPKQKFSEKAARIQAALGARVTLSQLPNSAIFLIAAKGDVVYVPAGFYAYELATSSSTVVRIQCPVSNYLPHLKKNREVAVERKKIFDSWAITSSTSRIHKPLHDRVVGLAKAQMMTVFQ